MRTDELTERCSRTESRLALCALAVGITALGAALRNSLHAHRRQAAGAAAVEITGQSVMEERIRSIAQFPEENPSPVLRLGHEGQVLYANKAAASLLAEMRTHDEEACPPALLAVVERALGTGREQELEVACRKGRCFSFFCVPVPQRQYANLYGRDVTAARRAERALQESERRFRGTFENAAVGIAHIDVDGRFLRVNETFSQMLGYGRDQLRGRGFVDLTHPEDREADQARFASMMRAETDSDTLEKRYLRADGSSVSVLVTRSLQRDESGRPAFAISIVQDITDRKRAEEALRKSEAFAQRVLASSLSGLYIFDLSGLAITYISPQYTRLTGYTLDQLRAMSGDQFLGLFHPGDRAMVTAHIAAAAHAADGEVREIDYRFRTAGGRWIWCSSRETVFTRNPDGSVRQYLGSFLDVTERKRAEEALEAAKQAAEEANHAKDHFLAVLSHELRTPLTPAVAAVSMLQNDPCLDERTQESLEVIRRNVEMEARLIDDLLDVTRIVRGKIELDRRPVPLSDVIHRAVEVCKPDIDARGLHFGLDVGPCADRLVHADPARLQQVFWNLLKNAIKFTPHGGCVGVRCTERDHGLVTEVTDSGEGIDRVALPHVFNPFEQGGSRVTRQFGGLGLGLTITKGLVEMHGGTISAHSDGKGKGATFRVLLPVHAAVEAALPAGGQGAVAAGRTAAAPERPPLRILLVEDHGDTAMMMGLLLAADGHEVETAGDVFTALTLAETRPFDLLLSDLGLPDGTGIDLMRTLRRRGHALPGIVLSGYGREEDIRGSIDAGFAIHLTKPTSPERLAEAVAGVTGRGGPTPPAREHADIPRGRNA
ncbi:MAG TPA: PAS domain S-box protein [Vicinamibacterales bacterium]|nr:PAS domain S-box protein [Vicinamibacterales bacterium]